MGTDEPLDLYIASYSDLEEAGVALASLQRLQEDDAITLKALALVNRDSDGKIHVDEHTHDVRKGSTAGAVGGLVVGLIFPPSLLASGVVGAGIGAGVGRLRAHRSKNEIKADVAEVLAPDTSGIVVLVDTQSGSAELEDALSSADLIKRERVDRGSADEVEAAVAQNV